MTRQQIEAALDGISNQDPKSVYAHRSGICMAWRAKTGHYLCFRRKSSGMTLGVTKPQLLTETPVSLPDDLQDLARRILDNLGASHETKR